MSLSDLIAIVSLSVIVGAIIYYMLKTRKISGCAGCPYCKKCANKCHSKKEDNT